MLDKLRSQVLEKVTAIFATMFFLIVEPIEDCAAGGEASKGPEGGGQDPDPSFVKGTIGLSGEKTGTIRLYLPYALAQKMAENFLGLEEEVITRHQILDMTGELINMIAGNIISGMETRGEWRLTMPRAEISAPPPREEKTPGEKMTIFFRADEGWGKLEVCLAEE